MTFHERATSADPLCHFCLTFAFILLSCLFLQPCDHLLENNLPLGSLVCILSSDFVTFLIVSPWSGKVLDCINS